MQIYLIGFMGAGKTSVGSELAQRINYPFLDLDEVIEEEYDDISTIFEENGEEFFRLIESHFLKEISTYSDRFVLATGGGVVLKPENLKLMKDNGLVFYLSAPAHILTTRLMENTEHRPLLNVKDLDFQVNHMLEQRESLYMQADFTIDASKSIKKVADSIMKIYEHKLNET